jgi:hypothetical protein
MQVVILVILFLASKYLSLALSKCNRGRRETCQRKPCARSGLLTYRGQRFLLYMYEYGLVAYILAKSLFFSLDTHVVPVNDCVSPSRSTTARY